MSGAERVVRLGSMFYVDPGGRPRRADCGAAIQVHPDFVARFDRLNVLAGQTEPQPVEQLAAGEVPPKRRPGRPRKTP